MTTWFPYFLDPTDSADGQQADCALTDFANSRVCQLTSYWSNIGGTDYDDIIFVSSSVDGTYTTSSPASSVCGVSGNRAFDGANGGRASRIGTDGFLYITTIDNGGGFGNANYGLSKINIGTLTETAFMTPSVITRFSTPIMVAFKIGATNYIALVESGVGDPAYIEIINVDTMVSAGSVPYPDGNGDIGGLVVGGSPDVNSIELFIVHSSNDYRASVLIEQVVYSTMTGFAVATTSYGPLWIFDYRWTDRPYITSVAYDPNDAGLFMFLRDSSGTNNAYLIKLSGTAVDVFWQNSIPSQFIDTYAHFTPFDISNGRLIWVNQDDSGDYLFVDTVTGYTATGNNILHLVDLQGEPQQWDGPNNRITYLDGGDNDFIDPDWWNGWANFDTAWITPTTPPTGAPIPATFEIVVVAVAGDTSITVPNPPFPGMSLSSVQINANGGGQSGGAGLEDAPGLGGGSADFARTTTSDLVAGTTYDIQIGLGGDGATPLQFGTDTWFKDGGSTIIMLAAGFGTGTPSVGDLINAGAGSATLTHSSDGSYGNIAIPGFGGIGGSGAAGPNFPGSHGGDTNYAVGQPGGTGAGAADSAYDAPGQVFIGLGFGTFMGYGGAKLAPPAVGGPNGYNIPFGHLDPGGGADGSPVSDTRTQGGDGIDGSAWTDTFTGVQVGPGSGGGGGGGGGTDNQPATFQPGLGGNAGKGGGGGGGSGGWPSAGTPVRGSAYTYGAFTGTPKITSGDGGDGYIAMVATFVSSGTVSLEGTTQFALQGSLAAPNSVALSAVTSIQIKARLASFVPPVPPPPPPPPPAPGLGPFDWRPTVISQYQNSPILLQLLRDFHDHVDPNADFDHFYNLIWNVDTAVGYGLDVWGRIVGVIRTLQVASGRFLGFEEADVLFVDPFNTSPFWIGTGSTSNFQLSDDAFRILIFAKALANISDGSIKAINQLLLNLFPGQGNCYVTDGNNMTMTYTFEFPLTPVQFAIISQSGVLPRSTGVSATVNVI